ncbi:hypothetical protein P691DRAFT_523436 [Macrolepiota fuliginosa MF-IS2]|uniref:Uncharacterized protein n=1 Tax=Macrolepiota fuliginosa MF-IS2 TaxID=1400762 RepID=A0A9P5XM44_9AGAR|nr:hypothetical protein P691DRAFT_523436 [Macrolepiota fuliginosa MF-IS2]
MSQRLLVHLHDASRERRMESEDVILTVTSDILSPREVSEVARTQFTHKYSGSHTFPFRHQLRRSDLERTFDQPNPERFDVHVRAMKVERLPRTIQSEDYSRRTSRAPARNVQTRH